MTNMFSLSLFLLSLSWPGDWASSLVSWRHTLDSKLLFQYSIAFDSTSPIPGSFRSRNGRGFPSWFRAQILLRIGEVCSSQCLLKFSLSSNVTPSVWIESVSSIEAPWMLSFIRLCLLSRSATDNLLAFLRWLLMQATNWDFPWFTASWSFLITLLILLPCFDILFSILFPSNPLHWCVAVKSSA